MPFDGSNELDEIGPTARDQVAPEWVADVVDAWFTEAEPDAGDTGPLLQPWELFQRPLDGRYDVFQHLHDGPRSHYLLARHRRSGRTVMLEVLHGLHPLAAPLAREFIGRATLAGRLQHPNILAVHDCGHTPRGIVYLAAEPVAGRGLRAVLDGETGIPLGRVVRIGGQIAAALAEAHLAGVAHGHLDASAVVLGGPRGHDDFVVLRGFGCALDDAAVARDLAGLGGILCALLSGREAAPGEVPTLPPAVIETAPPDVIVLVRALLASERAAEGYTADTAYQWLARAAIRTTAPRSEVGGPGVGLPLELQIMGLNAGVALIEADAAGGVIDTRGGELPTGARLVLLPTGASLGQVRLHAFVTPRDVGVGRAEVRWTRLSTTGRGAGLSTVVERLLGVHGVHAAEPPSEGQRLVYRPHDQTTFVEAASEQGQSAPPEVPSPRFDPKRRRRPTRPTGRLKKVDKPFGDDG